MKGEEDENPFKLPPDDQIFLIREQERQQRAEHREKVKHQHVWEKTTSSVRINRSRRVEDGTDDATIAAEAQKTRRGGASSTRTEGATLGRDTRREKENVADFVAKKREMFLVQMSLDVKKAEILKLDERAKQKEEALKKSQQMLEEDINRFDVFLANNDQKAHKAMKTAEDMTKKKQDRMQRIKQLKSQLSAIQSEIAKHTEQKIECLKFKDFLENLTPLEWKEMQADEKRKRKSLRRQYQVERRMGEIHALMHAEIEAEERAMEEKEKESTKGRRRQRREADEEAKEKERELEARRRRIRRKYPSQEAVEAEIHDVSSGEEMPLYFQEPKQLLDIFTSLEESNLFLIQNSQDTEQALEELEQKFAEMRRTRGMATNKMKQQISQLERQIADEKAKSDELRQAIGQKHGASEQVDIIKELAEKVVEVHTACGYETEKDPDTLLLLGAVEAKLEEFLTFLDEAEEAGLAHQVKALEGAKERNRRAQRLRHLKEEQDMKVEKRLKESLQRSQAPVHKKVGKQIMFRSAPLFQTRRIVQEDDGYEEAVREHDIFGIWLGKDGLPNAAAPSKVGN
eukprot:TRINITY_DN95131_c0_g1_i1.p1 TRINITY_DN95131_c0_g1~~TRINITY_DN95131_c0_g1_i1.p1  ORF type:complete len:572 (-),score=178.31 TRINITY_DN95131_c0_g1_i1:117-1832(-)